MELKSNTRNVSGRNYGALATFDSLENGPVSVKTNQSNISETPSEVSVYDLHRSVPVPSEHQSFWSKMMAYAGPGALVAVGYMDPGNWSTDIGGGSAYNYDLLFIVLWSSIIAFFFQLLSVKLAIATGKDLAQACKGYYSDWTNWTLWLAAETAIIATDLAEVLGSAIALQLLFGWRLEIGVLITAADVGIVFLTQVCRYHSSLKLWLYAHLSLYFLI